MDKLKITGHDTRMVLVHHLENSRSQRVLWLLEELGIPYEVKVYKRHPITLTAPPELKAVHPLGKSPVLQDGDRTVAESAVILEYLIDRYGEGKNLRPVASNKARERYDYWMHYAEGSLMPWLLIAMVFIKIKQAKVLFLVKPVINGLVKTVRKTVILPQVTTHLDFIEGELKHNTCFVSDNLTGADIQMSYPLEAVSTRLEGLHQYPRIKDFVSRVQARPAYQRALARANSLP